LQIRKMMIFFLCDNNFDVLMLLKNCIIASYVLLFFAKYGNSVHNIYHSLIDWWRFDFICFASMNQISRAHVFLVRWNWSIKINTLSWIMFQLWNANAIKNNHFQEISFQVALIFYLKVQVLIICINIWFFFSYLNFVRTTAIIRDFSSFYFLITRSHILNIKNVLL
jgi:hypothetical protein